MDDIVHIQFSIYTLVGCESCFIVIQCKPNLARWFSFVLILRVWRFVIFPIAVDIFWHSFEISASGLRISVKIQHLCLYFVAWTLILFGQFNSKDCRRNDGLRFVNRIICNQNNVWWFRFIHFRLEIRPNILSPIKMFIHICFVQRINLASCHIKSSWDWLKFFSVGFVFCTYSKMRDFQPFKSKYRGGGKDNPSTPVNVIFFQYQMNIVQHQMCGISLSLSLAYSMSLLHYSRSYVKLSKTSTNFFFLHFFQIYFISDINANVWQKCRIQHEYCCYYSTASFPNKHSKTPSYEKLSQLLLLKDLVTQKCRIMKCHSSFFAHRLMPMIRFCFLFFATYRNHTRVPSTRCLKPFS